MIPHLSNMVSVKVSCPIYPSEKSDKVKKAIINIFPDAELEETGRGFKGTASLDYFSKLIRKQEILDSTRSMLFKGIRDSRTVIHLNKQVATVGKVSFTDARCILGSIDVIIEDEDLETLINRIAPETVDGKEVRA